MSARPRLLLVEDDEAVRLLVTHALGGADVDVLVAESSAAAHAEIAAKTVDAVVLDLVLPDGDGRRLLSELRATPRTAGVPVVVLSGKGGSATQRECFRLGADEFFEKPFDPEVLAAALARQLSRAGAAAAERRIDPVTRLPNRAALEERFSGLVASASQRKEPLTLAYIELDSVDLLYDRFGRSGMDRLLESVGTLVEHGTRATDLVGRWRGGEFVVLLPGSRLGPARSVIERILDTVRTHTVVLSELTAADVSRLPADPAAMVTHLVDNYPGVGARTAETLVGELGTELFRVLEANPARVRALLPKARAERVLEGWQADRHRRRSQAEDSDGSGEQERRATFSAGIVDATGYSTLEQAVLAAQAMLGRRDEGPATIAVSEDGEEADTSQVRVLLVDDDEAVALLVRHRLEREGFEVEHLPDGDAASRVLSGEEGAEFDLILLDVRLPGVGGFELLESLRSRRAARRVPVVMLTAMGKESDVVRAFELGADDYVVKPFSPVELIARLHRLLRSR